MVRPQKFRPRPARLKSMRDGWTRGPAVALWTSASARAGMTLPGSAGGTRSWSTTGAPPGGPPGGARGRRGGAPVVGGLLDLVDPDERRGELARGVPLVGASQAVTGVVRHVVDQAGTVRDARRDAREHDRREVVALDRVDARCLAGRRLVRRREVVRRGAARAGQDRALGRGAGLRDELRVVGAVRRDERDVDAAVAQLLDERRGLRVVAGVEHGVGVGARDDLDGRGEVLVARLDLGGALVVRRVTETLGDLLGEPDAVVRVVGDDADAAEALRVDEVLRDRRALDGVVREAAEEVRPAVLRQVGVRGRRAERQQARLAEDVAGGRGLAGERWTEEAEHGRVADDLRRDLGRLLRVALGVELLDRHLAPGVRRVELVHRELRPVE